MKIIILFITILLFSINLKALDEEVYTIQVVSEKAYYYDNYGTTSERMNVFLKKDTVASALLSDDKKWFTTLTIRGSNSVYVQDIKVIDVKILHIKSADNVCNKNNPDIKLQIMSTNFYFTGPRVAVIDVKTTSTCDNLYSYSIHCNVDFKYFKKYDKYAKSSNKRGFKYVYSPKNSRTLIEIPFLTWGTYDNPIVKAGVEHVSCRIEEVKFK